MKAMPDADMDAGPLPFAVLSPFLPGSLGWRAAGGTCLGLRSVEVPSTSLRNDCKTNRRAGKQPFQAFIALVCFLRQNQVYLIHAQACVAGDLAA
ncbi:hypothetical protein Defa_24110 [Desulfovibrio sp. TH_2024_36128]|uniref:Uncharacterized protein n=1 Tax=Desulfovibrio falkowii TaxID=3136602 RepID=A0ABQ0EBB0_9BACT